MDWRFGLIERLHVTSAKNIMFKIEFLKTKALMDLLRTSRTFLFALERLVTRPLKKYAGYTVVPGITIPLPPSSSAHPSFKPAESGVVF